MLVYQRDNSTEHEHFQVDVYTDFQFFPHFHRDLEFFLMLEGEMEVQVHGRAEDARAGDLGLVFSNQVHAFKTAGHSKVLVCPFSGSYVSTFMRETEGYVGERAVFPCDQPLKEYLKSCFLSTPSPDKLTLKASLYALCARYLQMVPLVPIKTENNDLLHRLLSFVEENYRDDITLKSAAKAIGYDENYLSRYFHQMVGLNFRRFLNQYRIEYACRLMEDRSTRLSDIALECGFQNIRSFNRAFLDIVGRAPSEHALKYIQGKN